MKIGVFTPLLFSLPLDDVPKKLRSLDIDTVEFGTSNYPGDAHCYLSMLDNPGELTAFKFKITDAGRLQRNLAIISLMPGMVSTW